MADTLTSIQQGADMTDMVQSTAAGNDHVLQYLSHGRVADAALQFHASSAQADALWAKGVDCRVAVAMAGAILGAVVLTRSVATPLALGVSHLDRIAQGDLSQDTPAGLEQRADEIGTLARAMQKMTGALRTMIRDIPSGVQALSASSAEMMSSSTQRTAGAVQASDKAHSVSAAAEQMSANFSSVAAGMERTTTNLVHIASATEEMTATIGGIAQNSERARTITEEANRQAASIAEQINHWG